MKFHDSVHLHYLDGVEKQILKLGLAPFGLLVEQFPGVTINRLLTSLPPKKIKALVQQAIERDPTYHPPNLLTYFVAFCPIGKDPFELAAALRQWMIVELVYVEGEVVPPPAIAYPPTDEFYTTKHLGYLMSAPEGIDADYVWSKKILGGSGEQIGFIDIEQGWTSGHEDLPPSIPVTGPNSSGIWAANPPQRERGHGAGVLGIVVGVANNGKGGLGIASEATPSLVSHVDFSVTPPTNYLPSAILYATAQLKFGDVVLLEAQTKVERTDWSPRSDWLLPVEVEDGVFQMIRLATALGLIVVEAAGDGQPNDSSSMSPNPNRNNLDTFNEPSYRTLQNATDDDSGAIMVGAASSTAPHTRGENTNYGQRVNCYAWGDSIHTACRGDDDTCTDCYAGFFPSTSGTDYYAGGFGATSGSSAIIAGAALVVQGMTEQSLNYRLSPKQIRAILSDPDLGTLSSNSTSTTSNADGIGVMPDLRKIVDNDAFRLAPDVYVRDNLVDDGSPHTGPVASSPDIILRNNMVNDPEAEFGATSSTLDSDTLSEDVMPGQDNYLYVRVWNRGGAEASSVTAEVFWSEVATLVTGQNWNRIGSSLPVTVPSGNAVKVLGPITWNGNEIPKAGHACFICLVGNAADPPPPRADFSVWDNFVRYVRDNNNVTWRNFNVVFLPVPLGFFPLHFRANGAPDRPTRMRLEVLGGLPEGAELVLEGPIHVIDSMVERTPFVKIDPQRRVASVPLNPWGKSKLAETIFPAGTEPEFRLLVRVPQTLRTRRYRIVVRQLYENLEVGRVTWLLVPARTRLRDV